MNYAPRFLLRTLIFALVIIGGCTAALRVTDLRADARDCDCRSQLKQIGLALANYHDTYGVLPAAQARPIEGRLAHNWRVMILPFLDRVQLYEQYDMTVPWDHAKNDRVRQFRATGFFYGCPSGKSQVSGTTNYYAVVDESTAWPPNQTISFRSITDEPSETILVIEAADSAHNWSSTHDLTLKRLMSVGNASNHFSHVNALFADLRVRRVRTDIAPNTLRALLTVSGGEEISATQWQYQPQK